MDFDLTVDGGSYFQVLSGTFLNSVIKVIMQFILLIGFTWELLICPLSCIGQFFEPDSFESQRRWTKGSKTFDRCILCTF